MQMIGMHTRMDRALRRTVAVEGGRFFLSVGEMRLRKWYDNRICVGKCQELEVGVSVRRLPLLV